MNTSCVSDTMEDLMEAEEQQECAEANVEEGDNAGAVCPPSSPIHLRALDTPPFSLMYNTVRTNLIDLYS